MNLMAATCLLLAIPTAAANDVEFFAAIKSPVENSTFENDRPIPVEAVLLSTEAEPMWAKPPQVIVRVMNANEGKLLVQQEMVAKINRDPKHPNRFNIGCELDRRRPFEPGTYLLRVQIWVDNELVAFPSKLIKVIEAKAAGDE